MLCAQCTLPLRGPCCVVHRSSFSSSMHEWASAEWSSSQSGGGLLASPPADGMSPNPSRAFLLSYHTSIDLGKTCRGCGGSGPALSPQGSEHAWGPALRQVACYYRSNRHDSCARSSVVACPRPQPFLPHSVALVLFWVFRRAMPKSSSAPLMAPRGPRTSDFFTHRWAEIVPSSAKARVLAGSRAGVGGGSSRDMCGPLLGTLQAAHVSSGCARSLRVVRQFHARRRQS